MPLDFIPFMKVANNYRDNLWRLNNCKMILKWRDLIFQMIQIIDWNTDTKTHNLICLSTVGISV